MAKSTRERKQALEDLLKLSPECKGTKSTGEHCNDAQTQLDAVEEANSEVREAPTLTQAVRAKEKDEVGGGQVKVNVL